MKLRCCRDRVEVLAYMEGHLPEGSYFVDWESFDHPQLGMLEIGARHRCWLIRCLVVVCGPSALLIALLTLLCHERF